MKSTIESFLRATILFTFIMPLKGVLANNPDYKTSSAPPSEHRGDIFISGIETVQSKYTNKRNPFLVKKRTPELNRSDCNTCHSHGLAAKSVASKTHNDIRLDHASQHGMTCLTCHNENSVESLKNPSNAQNIEINHAYLSCQGCHFGQTQDWAGGAHGKRVKIWAEPRIVYNCTECHNPHTPRFKQRWPKIISTLPERK